MSGPNRASWRYWVLFSLLGVLAGISLFFMVGKQSDVFAEGTYIGGVPVGGLSATIAQQTLASYAAKTEMKINVNGPDGYSKSLDIAALGGTPDCAASVNNAMAQGHNAGWFGWGKEDAQYFPLLLNYKDKDVERWLEQTRFDVDRKPTEPRVVWEGDAMRVAEPESGKRLNADAAKKALPKEYKAGEYDIKLVMDEVKAQVTSSELSGLVELSSSVTSFNAGNVNRTINLKKAAAALNGSVVAPGGVFSFNNTVGPRDLANGYMEAMVIIKNEFTPGVGGGICQVSSTLYNAALLAGFPIIQRRNHSVAVSYVPVGLDATVAYPYQDFRFKNNADSAVYVNAYTRGSKLYIKLFGRRDNPISVKIERFVDQTTPFTVVQKVDTTLQPGAEKVDHQGVEGYKVRTYRSIFDKSGQVRERKLLSTDTYAPLSKLVLVSPAAAQPGGTESNDDDIKVNPSVPVIPSTGENTLPSGNQAEPTTQPTTEPGVPPDDGLPEDAGQM